MKTLILALFLIFGTCIFGQAQDNLRAEVCIYDYGVPITSCENNFENLAQNWNKWIANRDELQLLSWKYVETLKNKKRIAYYAELMFNTETSTTTVGHGNGGYQWDDGQSVQHRFAWRVDMRTIPEFLEPYKAQDNFAERKAMVAKEFQEIKEAFISEAQIGDKVYRLKFKKNDKIYDYYVVCSPKTMRPLTVDFLMRIGGEKEEIDNWLQSQTSNFGAYEWNLNNKLMNEWKVPIIRLYGYTTVKLDEKAQQQFKNMNETEIEEMKRKNIIFADDFSSYRLYFPFSEAIVESNGKTFYADENGDVSILDGFKHRDISIVGRKRSENIYGGYGDMIEDDKILFKNPIRLENGSHILYGHSFYIIDYGEFKRMK